VKFEWPGRGAQQFIMFDTFRDWRRSTLFITSLPDIINGVPSIMDRLWDIESGSSGSMDRRGGRFFGECDMTQTLTVCRRATVAYYVAKVQLLWRVLWQQG